MKNPFDELIKRPGTAEKKISTLKDISNWKVKRRQTEQNRTN